MDISTIGNHSYFDETRYCKCCQNRIEKDYSIQHEPKPLDLTEKLAEVIEMILWYMPNIDSVQSFKHELIEESLFDDFTFAFFLDMMKMNEEDVLFLNPNEEIPDDIWNYYQNKVCTSCQKFVIVIQRNQTKTQNVLRCIRNSVAHGEFNIWDNYFIGFNTFKSKKKAIVKFNPELMLHALETLSEAYTRDYLYEYIFTKAGYTLDQNIITKNGKSYAIEIRYLPGEKRYLSQRVFEMLLNRARLSISDDVKKVLIVDNVRVKNEHTKLLNEQGVSVIDMSSVKELLRGVDVFENI